MTIPPAFQIGRSTSEALGRGMQRAADTSALDEILQRAEKSGDPEFARRSINEILTRVSPERQQAAIQLLQSRQQDLRNQRESKALGRIFKGEGTEEDFAQVSPERLLKAQQDANKAPPGGVTAQPVPPDTAKRMNEILKDSDGLSAIELKARMDLERIPPIHSNPHIESRRRQEEQTTAQKVQFHKDTAKLNEKWEDEAERGQRQIQALNRQKELQTRLTTVDRILGSIFQGTRLEDLFKSATAQEFDSLALPLIEGQRENFGIRLSDADLRLVMQKIATSTKNPNANAAIIDWWSLIPKMNIRRAKIAEEIKRENGGFRPIDFREQVKKRLDSEFGEEIENARDSILELKDDEKQLAKLGRLKVKQGTKPNRFDIEKYKTLSNGDEAEARRMMIEDGYGL